MIKGQGLGDNAFKIIGVILVITASIYVVTAGFSNEQITPVIGLLGTIVGYMIGTNTPTKASEDKGERKN